MSQVVMPQLGESVTEGTIARWLKQPGEQFERYEAIAEVVTDKVNAEIPAPVDGVMSRHLVQEGAIVAVGAPICDIDSGGGEAAPPAAAEVEAVAPVQAVAPVGAPEPAAAAPVPEVAAVEPEEAEPEPEPVAAAAAEGSTNGAVLHVTPAVRMLAREHGIDLSTVSGSGLGGRITKKDVLTHAQQRGSQPALTAPALSAQQSAAAPPAARAPAGAAPAATPPATAPAPTAPPRAAEELEGDTLVPLSQARRAIAEHMVRSKATSPHAWTTVEVDMTAVARARALHRAAFEKATGARLTFLPFVARATITSLRRFPVLNATFTPDGVLVRRSLHLGIAVALEDSLIVPVIRDADRLNLAGLAQRAADLGNRARAGRLRIEELTGGTFTLNNTGALGLVLTQPIINQPQAAILAMDAIVKRPVVVDDDAIAIRSMMNLSISFDHRLIDGLAAARFIRDIKAQLEAVDENQSLL